MQIPLQMKFTCKLPKKLADPWSNTPLPPPHPLILGGSLQISDQNNWEGGGPEQKIKFGGS